MTLAVAAAGWAGAACLLLAYALASAGRLPADGAWFQALNLAGGAALAANSGYHHAWPSAALNLVWIAIGAAALRQARRQRVSTAGTRSGASAESRDQAL